MSVENNGLLKTVLAETIGDEGLLVVGVSGGPDSLALLHQLLTHLPPERIYIAHLDHGMRPQSEQEAQRVAEIAHKWRSPFRTASVDAPRLARQAQLSLEEAAREARYRFLAEVAREVGGTVVAVGHNSDDQVETILLHFLRGSGLTGLRGMQPVTQLPGAPELTLIRPLLDQSRAEIEAYCHEHELRPIFDESNRDQAFLRNRVRHHLLPLLATYNPQIRAHLLRLGEIAAEDDSLVRELAEQVWSSVVEEVSADLVSFNRRRWLELPLALQRRTVRRAYARLRPAARDLSFAAVQQAIHVASRKKSGSTSMLPEGVALYVDYDRLILSIATSEVAAGLPQVQSEEAVSLAVPGRLALGQGWILESKIVAPDLQEILANDDPWRAYVDVQGREQLQVRGRLPGERMQPLGMGGRSASMQDVMVNRKIQAAARALWPVVATAEHTVWLVGHQIDRRSRVTDSSQSIVLLECVLLDEEVC